MRKLIASAALAASVLLGGVAHASCVLPYTFTNQVPGQFTRTIDAVAMMADLEALANCQSGTNVYQIGFSFIGGSMANSEILGLHRFSAGVTFPANFGVYSLHNSTGGGTTAPAGTVVITVMKALNATPTTFTQVGTITFSSGSVNPVFVTNGGAPVSFAQDDVIELMGPAVADQSFANFFITLVGYLS